MYYHVYYGGGIMITLRLDPRLEQQLNYTAKNLGLTKSELIRKSLVDYFKKIETKSAWESGQDLFGKYSSGRNDLSSNRKELLKNKLQAKKNEQNSY